MKKIGTNNPTNRKKASDNADNVRRFSGCLADNRGSATVEAAIYIPLIILVCILIFWFAIFELAYMYEQTEGQTSSEKMAMRLSLDEKQTSVVYGGSQVGEAEIPDDDWLSAYYSYQNTYGALFLNTKSKKNLKVDNTVLNQGKRLLWNVFSNWSVGLALKDDHEDGMNGLVLTEERKYTVPIMGIEGLSFVTEYERKNIKSFSADCAELIRAHSIIIGYESRTGGCTWANGKNDYDVYLDYFSEVLANYSYRR